MMPRSCGACQSTLFQVYPTRTHSSDPDEKVIAIKGRVDEESGKDANDHKDEDKT